MKTHFKWEVFKSIFKKPATIPYSGGHIALDSRVRGLIRYDREQCVACFMCMRDCPTGALKVVNNGTREEKDMHAYLDTGKCIFCGQCADSCSKHCISCSTETDLARFGRDGLTIEL